MTNSNNVTLDLVDAAKLLKIHPATLQLKAKAGEIPGAKPDKCWVFISTDLLDWLRSQYTNNRQDVSKEAVCSLKEKPIGIISSPSRDKQYTDLLEPVTKNKRKPSMQKSTVTH